MKALQDSHETVDLIFSLVLTALVTSLTCLVTAPAEAQHHLRSRKCFETLDVEPFPLPIMVPIGCETPGCCPGCEEGPIDLVVRTRGIDNLSLTLALENVAALRDLAVPSLAAALDRGPTPAKRELLRRQARAAYRDLMQTESPLPGAEHTMSESDYVEAALKALEARYRARAREALAAIGGAYADRIPR